jgi:rhodanese-related sulfurtransferase
LLAEKKSMYVKQEISKKKKENKMKRLMVLLMVALMLFSFGCSKDEDVDPFVEMMNYLVDNGRDINDILVDWIVPAATVNANLSNYYVIDVRAAADYADGHIPGAVNSPLADVVTAAEAAPAGKTIITVCYAGQAAGHATAALRMMGYDARTLKWGMSGWNPENDVWTSRCASPAVGNANWTKSAHAAAQEFDYPEFETDLEDGAEILTERVEYMLSKGYQGASASDVLANPGNYFINNFWDANSWSTYGGFVGSYRINPLTLENDEIIGLDPGKTVVTYCWTGQTSSVVTAYLTALGYDAKSLTSGVNALIYSELPAGATKWDPDAIPEYDKE